MLCAFDPWQPDEPPEPKNQLMEGRRERMAIRIKGFSAVALAAAGTILAQITPADQIKKLLNKPPAGAVDALASMPAATT